MAPCDVVPGKQSRRTSALPAQSRTLWTARTGWWTRAVLGSPCTFGEEQTQRNFASEHVYVGRLSPADLHRVAQVVLVLGFPAVLEEADIEEGQRVIDEAMHGAVRAVLVLVDHPRDEVGGEGDDKGLLTERSTGEELKTSGVKF